jgi:hypothetical protein
MTINQELVKFLHNSNVECDLALLYLLSLYHGLTTDDLIPEATVRAVNTIGIVERDYKTNTLNWHIALYDGQSTDGVWEWVNEFRKLFASKNKEREGNKKACVQRMKMFFTQNPDIRKQDVLEATMMYLRSTDPKYVKMAERFIFDGQGNYKTSLLTDWVDRLREIRMKQIVDPTTKIMK